MNLSGNFHWSDRRRLKEKLCMREEFPPVMSSNHRRLMMCRTYPQTRHDLVTDLHCARGHSRPSSAP